MKYLYLLKNEHDRYEYDEEPSSCMRRAGGPRSQRIDQRREMDATRTALRCDQFTTLHSWFAVPVSMVNAVEIERELHSILLLESRFEIFCLVVLASRKALTGSYGSCEFSWSASGKRNPPHFYCLGTSHLQHGHGLKLFWLRLRRFHFIHLNSSSQTQVARDYSRCRGGYRYG